MVPLAEILWSPLSVLFDPFQIYSIDLKFDSSMLASFEVMPGLLAPWQCLLGMFFLMPIDRALDKLDILVVLQVSVFYS
jgi:hypothetical protein